MFASPGRDDVNDELRVRARAGFRTPEADEVTRERVLTDARGRAAGIAAAAERPASSRGMTARVGVVLMGAAVVLATFFLEASRSPIGVPVQKASAAVVLSRAKAAISETSTTLHVVATTESSQLPVPEPMQPQPAGSSRKRHGHKDGPAGPLVLPGPPTVLLRDTLQEEHWLDRVHGRRRSTVLRFRSWESGAWSRELTELLEKDGLRTNVLMTGSSGEASSTQASVNTTNDRSGTKYWSILDRERRAPEEQLRDTSDPDFYFELLSGGALGAPNDSDSPYPPATTSVTLADESVVDGVPVYVLRVTSSSRSEDGTSGSDTTLTVSIQRSDYLPVRVEGTQTTLPIDRSATRPGFTWVTRYNTVETLAATKVPRSTFRLDIPEDVAVKSNTLEPPERIAASTPFGVDWLGRHFEGLRFTGSFRTTRDTTEYELWVAEIQTAQAMADSARPELSRVQTVAEYTPDGTQSNLMTSTIGPELKVISMPRTDPKTWEAAFSSAEDQMPGKHDDAWIMKRTWMRIDGRKALRLHHRWRWGNGTAHGHIILHIDYLVIDRGDSTVMIQGALAKPGQIERAAKALVRAK